MCASIIKSLKSIISFDTANKRPIIGITKEQ